MKRKKTFVTAVFLSGTMGLGAQLGAQSVPDTSGPSKPAVPGQTGPAVPEPGPTMPPQTQPTIPGQPAPGLPQSKPFPGQPSPGLSQTEPIPGQTAPLPGQPGTIPEKVAPDATNPSGTMAGSSEKTKQAQEALKARGFDPGSTSGAMDAKTQQALRDFQKANKLPVTGVLDAKTAQQLGIAMESEQRSLPPLPQSGSTPSQPGMTGGTPSSSPR